MKLPIYYFLILLLLLTGCKKSGSPIQQGPVVSALPYYIKYSQASLPYVLLPEGKYRIYKDSATGTLDSVVIVKSELKENYVAATGSGWTATKPYYFESLKIRWEKKNPPESVLIDASGSAFLPVEWTIYNAPVLLYSDNIPRELLFQSEPPTTSTLTLQVEGQTYHEVIATIYQNGNNPNIPGYKKTIHYWAKNIGLIKRTLILSGGFIKTENLTRYEP